MLAGEIARLERDLAAPDAWSAPERARALSAELHRLRSRAAELARVNQKHDDVATFVELYQENPDAATLSEAGAELAALEELVNKTEMRLFLSGKYDEASAIVAIHAGQGGTESCDWAQMLYRMYQRWAERESYGFRPLDLLPGEVAGYKSATFAVQGAYAFGYLKAEAGVHRLVRISPFDAAARRQTTFASVEVLPDIEEVTEVEVNPTEIRVDTYRSSGAGGQHVNKTDSAIRITHLLTGIVVTCQNERSQHSNRESAMRMLKARLLAIKREEQDRERAETRGEKKQSTFGSQIRSYVLAPYVMVKDHRTGHETGNAVRVLDGDLEPFILAYLLKHAGDA
jgi:peptide chain release factor 2